MKIFGWEIKRIKNKIQQQEKRKKAKKEKVRGKAYTPSFIDYSQGYASYLNGYYNKEELISDDRKWLIAKNSQVLQNILQALKVEVFRRGIEIQPNFVKRCKVCGTEYQEEVSVCSVCGSGEFEEPNKEEKEILENILKQANNNGETLIDVLEEYEDDLNIFDNAYLVIEREYYITEGGLVKFGGVKEIYRADPRNFALVLNQYGEQGKDDEGNELYFCVKERGETTTEKVCKKHKIQNLKAMYVIRGRDGKEVYYSDEEVIHESKYNPSRTYGYSILNAIYREVLILDAIKEQMFRWYKENRAPKGIILFKGDNSNELKDMIEKVRIVMKENPNAMVPISIAGENASVEPIELTKTPEEMQMMEFMNELKREIGAIFGVMPIWQSDVSTSGGLNNEGLQILVTNRAMERAVRVYNEKVFPRLMKALGITDYTYHLKGQEALDEYAETQLLQQNIQLAEGFKSLGYDVEWDEDAKRFRIGKKIENNNDEYNQISTNPPDMSGEPLYQSVRDILKEDLNLERKKMEEKLTKEFKRELARIKKLKKKDELIEVYKEVYDKLKKKYGEAIKKQLTNVFVNEVVKLRKKLKKKVEINENALRVILNSNILRKSLDDFFKELADRVQEIMLNAYLNPDEYDDRRVIKELAEVIEESEARVRLIARMETQNIGNLARELTYKQLENELGEMKYKWIGPRDKRTTEICRRIEERTKKGVSMEELKKIIQEEADKKMYNPERPYTPHFGCRHTFVAVRWR